MTDTYFDPEMQQANVDGYRNGLAGKTHTPAKYRQAYFSGNQTGLKERAEKIHNARVENIKRVRKAKNDKITSENNPGIV